MAGTIEVRPGIFWHSSSQLFYFVLQCMTAEVEDAQLVERLREIDQHNLGSLSLPDLPGPQKAEVEKVIRERLIDRAELDLPETERKPEIVDYIRGLVDALAGKPLEDVPGHARRRRGKLP